MGDRIFRGACIDIHDAQWLGWSHLFGYMYPCMARRKVTPKGIKAHDHFREACLSRGITTTDLDLLYEGLGWARQNDRQDLIEQAKKIGSVEFWRFQCPDGIFFAIFKPGDIYPKTVYSHRMYRAKMKAHKKSKRYRFWEASRDAR